MERHQAGHEEALVGVRLERGMVGVVQRPTGSPADCRGCLKCMAALAAVMGLVVVALVMGFLLHFFMFTPSHEQDARPSGDTTKVNITCKLKESNEQGRYDIFTVEKAGTYLIYGWLRLSAVTSEDITLVQTLQEKDRTIQKKDASEKEIFFFEKVKLANDIRLSIKFFKSSYADSSFHVYEV